MYDAIYKPEEVATEFQPIFEQLCTEFGAKCQIWRRVEDFGREVSAGVLNPLTQVAATVALKKGTQMRTTPLSPSEIKRIHEHLASGAAKDLAL